MRVTKRENSGKVRCSQPASLRQREHIEPQLAMTRALLPRPKTSAAPARLRWTCYVAAGRLDGYFEIGLKPWDMAAGLLVREAGGSSATSPVRRRSEAATPWPAITTHRRIVKTIAPHVAA